MKKKRKNIFKTTTAGRKPAGCCHDKKTRTLTEQTAASFQRTAHDLIVDVNKHFGVLFVLCGSFLQRIRPVKQSVKIHVDQSFGNFFGVSVRQFGAVDNPVTALLHLTSRQIVELADDFNRLPLGFRQVFLL